MLLTITYTGHDTPDLGYLLYKNPYRAQVFSLSFGRAYVYYPEVSDSRTTAALLLDINPLDLARGKVGSSGGGLFDYVNDRPYVASSFMSTAIAKVFGTAMSGRADEHQALSDSCLDLTAKVTMLPCRGEQAKLVSVFEPLGYEVSYESFSADEEFAGWGTSVYVDLTLTGHVRLRDLLRHLYVLIPVFDRRKHYWVTEDEIDKLLHNAQDWLPGHPEQGYITGRYLARSRRLTDAAMERLAEAEADSDVDEEETSAPAPDTDRAPNLNTQRLDAVLTELKNSGAARVIDLGCGEGRLLQLLIRDRQFTGIAGVDVSVAALQMANRKLRLNRASESLRERVQLFQGSLTYKDDRFADYDAACLVEVIEHLDPARLPALERVVFEFARPRVVVLTTPNSEYNANYEFLPEEGHRHGDHRFEWTRAEFEQWARATAEKFGYNVRFAPIGPYDELLGAPTQMGVFERCE